MLEISKYLAKRHRLQGILSSIRVVLSDFNLTNQAEDIKEDFYRLSDEKFNLVIVGEFSRGKSTFVNALLGRRMLPVSKNPTTAVISKIVYGETAEYIVHYKSGETKMISEGEFLDIKAQSEGDVLNLDKLKDKLQSFVKHQEKLDEIEYVEICYPLALCKNNVEVVDTPGTNDLNVGRVDITYNYLRKADAAILVLMATQALTKSEMDFLKEQIIGNQISDIFIVINGKDQCKTSDEEARVIKYVSDNLASVIPQKLKVFLLSSKQALTWRRKENGEELPKSAVKFLPGSIEDTGFSPFEEAIGSFLSDERGRAKLEKYVAKAKEYLDAIEEQIRAQYDAADHSSDELKAQFAEMQPKVRKAQVESARILQSMKTRLLAKESELVNEGRQAFMAMRQAAATAFDACEMGEPPGKIKHRIDVAVTPIQKAFINNVTSLQQNWIQTEWGKAVSEMQTIWQDMRITSNIKLDMSTDFDFSTDIMSGVHLKSAGDEASVGNIATGVAGAAAVISGAWIVLGAALIADAIINDKENAKRKATMKNQLITNFDRKYDGFNQNIVSQYNRHVSNICKSLQHAVDRRLGNMEQRLASVIQMKEASEGDAAQIMSKLEMKKATVDKLRHEMEEVMA